MLAFALSRLSPDVSECRRCRRCRSSVGACRSSVGAVSIDTGVDGVDSVWPVSDRCLRVVGQGDAWVVSERVGVSSVGVSSVSEVSRVSDVSDRRTCVLEP